VTDTGAADWHDASFVANRGRLLSVAYQMLGTMSDAEDIVQEVFLRWQRVARERVRDPVGYLIRITTRLCLDHMKSARARREVYVGEWLPEPVLTGGAEARLDHEVTLALLLALERLTPLERAAFLLHDVFDQPFAKVSQALDRSPATCRQLAARARAHVRGSEARAPVDPDQGAEIAEAFFHAARSGDVGRLEQLLAEDVKVVSDGGGKVASTINPIFGRDRVVRLFEGLARKFPRRPEAWRFCEVNGLPAILSREADGLIQTVALAVSEGRIAAVYITRNPDKTRHLAAALEKAG